MWVYNREHYMRVIKEKLFACVQRSGRLLNRVVLCYLANTSTSTVSMLRDYALRENFDSQQPNTNDIAEKKRIKTFVNLFRTKSFVSRFCDAYIPAASYI